MYATYDCCLVCYVCICRTIAKQNYLREDGHKTMKAHDTKRYCVSSFIYFSFSEFYPSLYETKKDQPSVSMVTDTHTHATENIYG